MRPHRTPRRISLWLVTGALLIAGPARAQTAGPSGPLLAAGEAASDLQPVEVDAEGDGPTRNAAIARALSAAVAQETGTAVIDMKLSAAFDIRAQGAATSSDTTDTVSQGDKTRPTDNKHKDAKPEHAKLKEASASPDAPSAACAAKDGGSLRDAMLKRTAGTEFAKGDPFLATPLCATAADALPRARDAAPEKGHVVKDEAASSKQDLAADASMDAVGTFSGGRIARYSVLSMQPLAGGGFTARVHATLDLYRRAPSAADHKRRVSVAGFTGEEGSSMAAALHDRLVMDLAQSRRFVVVDRSHDDEYTDEMAIAGGSNASPAERARLGQVLGADYMLTGRIEKTASRTTGHAAQTTSQTLQLTGEVVSSTKASTLHTTPGALAVNFELIEIATRQITLDDMVSVSGGSIDAVAQRIADAILAAIYPLRLVQANDPQALIVNQGGSLMANGQRLRMMQEGVELFDPYSHESLGKTERMIGVIEIADVQPKISYARLVSGALPASIQDVVLRPEAAKLQAPRRAMRRARSVQSAPQPESDTGVRLPFDR